VPAAPTNVTATAQSSNSIGVSWTSVSGASEYRVYRANNSGGDYVYVATTYGAFHTNTGLSPNTTYYYKVSAGNDYGESARSDYASATTSGSVPGTPDAPTGVTATAQSPSSIYISWTSVSGASEYRVYWANNSGGDYVYVATTYDTFYTDTGLSSNTTYYYKVSAVNDYGEGARSDYASATTFGTVPAAPTNVTATAQSSSSISVSWNSVSGASEYYVYRSDNDGVYYYPVDSTYGDSYTDTELSSNTTYYYKVSAGNDYGESAQSNYTSATTSGSVPAAPTNVTATAQSSNSIYISWTSVSGASEYRVYRADNDGGYYSPVDLAYDTFYTNTGLSSNTTYYYKVSAINDYGEGAQSNYTSVTTFVSVPDGVTAVAQSSSSISVSWNPVSGASEYYVYRSDNGGGYYSPVDLTYNTFYTDTGLSPNTTYYYKVSAVNNDYVEGAQSNYAFATTLPPAGTLNITVGFNLGAIVITGSDGANIIRKSNSDSLTLNAAGYTNVVWYVDGGAPGISGDDLTINASDYPAQLHSVTFTGYKNGVLFSQAIPFTVLN
jgi:fibronectin type 3 domain-containing protein